MPCVKQLLLATLCTCAALPTTSYALSCLSENSGDTIIAPLGTTLAVNADAPNGTIIWESGPRSVRVVCQDDRNHGREEVYFYINPANTSIGQGIRAGIRYNSAPITQSSGRYGTGFFSDRSQTRFTLNFSVFIEKFGTTPQNGQATRVIQYRVFQLDGIDGINPTPDRNLNYIVSGVDGIRFVPCAPNLTISPSVLRFPPPSYKAKIGEVASTAAFNLSLSKTCDTPYTVNARFATTPGGGSLINGLLVPANNKSVGISLSREESSQTLPFNQWFALAQLNSAGQTRHDFRADLKWRTLPIPGAFDAAVIVDMFYK